MSGTRVRNVKCFGIKYKETLILRVMQVMKLNTLLTSKGITVLKVSDLFYRTVKR